GTDVSRSGGQVKRGESPPRKKLSTTEGGLPEKSRKGKDDTGADPLKKGGTGDTEAARAELEKQERIKLVELKGKIEAAVEASPQLRQYRNQMVLDIMSEGLRIQIVDEKNRPMFDL